MHPTADTLLDIYLRRWSMPLSRTRTANRLTMRSRSASGLSSLPQINAANKYNAAPNNGMHPTRDTLPVINGHRAGGRVMRGVVLLSISQEVVHKLHS